MGQKTNPIIFQLGKSRKWENIFEEKKQLEFTKYVENQVELQKFIKKYFKNHGLKVCEYSLSYKNNAATIFLSYFVMKTFFKNSQANKKKNKNYQVSSQKKKIILRKIVKKIYKVFLIKCATEKNKNLLSGIQTKNKYLKKNFFKRYIFKKEKLKREIIQQKKFKKFQKKRPWWDQRSQNKNWRPKNVKKFKNANYELRRNSTKKFKKRWSSKKNMKEKKLGFKYFRPFLKKRVSTLFKTFALFKKHSNLLHAETLKTINCEKIKNSKSVFEKNFFTKMFEIIKNYTGNNIDVIFNLKQIDIVKSTNKFEYKILKKKLSQLWRFKNQPFYKQGVNAIIMLLKHPNMLEFFVEHVAEEMQRHKRQHFFLNFIQKGLLLLNKSKVYPLRNITLKINGRFNGAPRSKQRVIVIGEKISVISADTQLHYSEKISISNRGGTFGIKAWISNSLKKNVKRAKKDKI